MLLLILVLMQLLLSLSRVLCEYWPGSRVGEGIFRDLLLQLQDMGYLGMLKADDELTLAPLTKSLPHAVLSPYR